MPAAVGSIVASRRKGQLVDRRGAYSIWQNDDQAGETFLLYRDDRYVTTVRVESHANGYDWQMRWDDYVPSPVKHWAKNKIEDFIDSELEEEDHRD